MDLVFFSLQTPEEAFDAQIVRLIALNDKASLILGQLRPRNIHPDATVPCGLL